MLLKLFNDLIIIEKGQEYYSKIVEDGEDKDQVVKRNLNMVQARTRIDGWEVEKFGEEQHCTIIETRRQHKVQDWFHCYTCKMVDRNGVCSICAR